MHEGTRRAVCRRHCMPAKPMLGLSRLVVGPTPRMAIVTVCRTSRGNGNTAKIRSTARGSRVSVALCKWPAWNSLDKGKWASAAMCHTARPARSGAAIVKASAESEDFLQGQQVTGNKGRLLTSESVKFPDLAGRVLPHCRPEVVCVSADSSPSGSGNGFCCPRGGWRVGGVKRQLETGPADGSPTGWLLWRWPSKSRDWRW